jgi:hypothetical protein
MGIASKTVAADVRRLALFLGRFRACLRRLVRSRGAVDGAILPQTGAPHAALFELAQPVLFPSDTKLVFKLTQGTRGHSLGRLRLSVTSDRSPSLPPAYLSVQVVAQGTFSTLC